MKKLSLVIMLKLLPHKQFNQIGICDYNATPNMKFFIDYAFLRENWKRMLITCQLENQFFWFLAQSMEYS